MSDAMTPNAQPVAYLRKSVRGRDEQDRSRDVQAGAVAALAARDGVTIARTYDGDWGRSGGRSGRDKRADMKELIAAIRAGDVSALYAYSLDRLARDTEYAMTLWNACADQGVPIIVDGMSYDTSDGGAEFHYTILAAQSKVELDKITKRNRDVKARARITGTSLGGPDVYGSDPKHPGEDPAVVVAAYREAGSFLGAARSLRAAGVPTRHGRPWSIRSVSILVRREAPEAAPVILARRGVSAKRTRLFSNLLACGGCGSILTAMPRPGRKRVDGSLGPGSISYYCRAEIRDARHAPPYMVSERKVLAWARREANRTSTLLKVSTGAAKVALSLGTIAAKRAAIVNLAADLTITPDDARRRLAKLATQTKDAEAAERAYMILGIGPRVDWSLPPAEVNATLRTIWAEVKLGPDMLPVKAEWIVSPDWTPDDPEPPRDADRDALDAARDRSVGDLIGSPDV
jgi:DNA invertase Pin-like site-specific DNA recombinase